MEMRKRANAVQHFARIFVFGTFLEN